MKQLFDIIGGYANIPDSSGNEYLIKDNIEKQLCAHVDDLWYDEAGNLYALRKGGREGRIMLCAHQDKVVYSNELGEIKEGNRLEINTPAENLLNLLDNNSFLVDSNLNQMSLKFTGNPLSVVIKKIKFNSMKKQLSRELYGYYSALRRFLIINPEATTWDFKRAPQYEALKQRASEFIQFFEDEFRVETENGAEGSKIISWPKFNVEENKITGKLDDALGLGIITYISQATDREEMPDILTVFTTEEEVGGHGARKACKKIKKMEEKPSKILVVDTTAFGKLGKGPVLYTSCGGVDFDENYILDLNRVANECDISLMNIKPPTFNDSTILAKKLRIPTVAVEVPIKGIHSEKETTTVSDIVKTYKLLEQYLRKGSIW